MSNINNKRYRRQLWFSEFSSMSGGHTKKLIPTGLNRLHIIIIILNNFKKRVQWTIVDILMKNFNKHSKPNVVVKSTKNIALNLHIRQKRSANYCIKLKK